MSDHDKAILSSIIGVVVIILGITAKQFYPQKGALLDFDNPSPTWFGRLIFVAVGSLFCATGLFYFFSPR
jgi:hypothetical protein